MKIRALIPSEPNNASNWWRIIQPFRKLSLLGHDAVVYENTAYESMDVDGAIVIIHRLIVDNANRYILDLYARGATAVLYSTDDFTIDEEAILSYLKDSGGVTSQVLKLVADRIPKQLEIIHACEAIIVSAIGLQELMDERTHKNVYCLPNAIDIDWFSSRLDLHPKYIGNEENVYIGWGGGRRPEADLEPMALAWKLIAENNEFDHVRFVVSGWQPDIIDRNIPLERKVRLPWLPLEQWPSNMQVDIGCCPLANTTFNRGKSYIKFLEYALSGAAVVASPTVYDQIIVHGINGFITKTNTVDEWYDYLSMLVSKKTAYRRRDLQKMAQYDVQNWHNLDIEIYEWVRLLEVFK